MKLKSNLFSRRCFLRGVATAGVLSGLDPRILANPGTRAAGAAPGETHRVTLAQLRGSRDVEKNLARAEKVFEQAARERAGWVFFPEGYLSGYWGGFDAEKVARAFDRVRELCRKNRVIGLIGTAWKELGKTFNQIRIVDTKGELVGRYGKTCLTYGDAKWAAPGTFPLVHAAGGIRLGTLICNDLWVTPGFSDGPNPHLSLKQARQGAQVIFHAIASGSNQRYRAYHESNLFTRAAEAKCPIVAVNAFTPPRVNAGSGVVGTEFRYLVQLPPDREVIQTVEFTPAPARA